MPTIEDFAKAIAIRISDEWDGKSDFPEDATMLQAILEKLFLLHPGECERFIGTGIIEDGYFDAI